MSLSTKSRGRSAIVAFVSTQVVYWCAVGVAAWAVTHVPAGRMRSALALTPILPAVLIFAITYRLYRACDEYLQQRILRAAAFTGLGTLLLVTSYYYLQLAGLPPLNLAWISAFGWTLFFIQILPLLLGQARREKQAD